MVGRSAMKIVFHVLAVALLLGGVIESSVHADDTLGMITADASVCGPMDPQCSTRIVEFMTSVNPLFPVRLESGVRMGWTGSSSTDLGVQARASVSLLGQVLELHRKGGDLKILPFELTLIPHSEQFRVRVQLAQNDVTFICSKSSGEGVIAPYASLFADGRCKPDAVFGVSAEVLQFQMDTFSTQRIAMRLAEVKGVINVLGNGMATDFLKRQLLLAGGASWDAIVPNQADPASGGQFPRLALTLSGLWISDDSHWEIRGFAGYRPSMMDMKDWAAELRTQIVHRFLLGYDFLGEVGGSAQYSHWSLPGRSLGTYASDRDQNTLFLGAVLGLSYDPPSGR